VAVDRKKKERKKKREEKNERGTKTGRGGVYVKGKVCRGLARGRPTESRKRWANEASPVKDGRAGEDMFSGEKESGGIGRKKKS